MEDRLPVYIMVARCGGMRGAPIQAAREGIKCLAEALKNEPNTKDIAYLSIIVFHTQIERLQKLTSLDEFNANPIPQIQVKSGGTFLGSAISELLKYLDDDFSNVGEIRFYSPRLFIITDGRISDLLAFRTVVEKINSQKDCKLKSKHIVAFIVGEHQNLNDLKLLIDEDNIKILNQTDMEDIKKVFELASSFITRSLKSD